MPSKDSPYQRHADYFIRNLMSQDGPVNSLDDNWQNYLVAFSRLIANEVESTYSIEDIKQKLGNPNI